MWSWCCISNYLSNLLFSTSGIIGIGILSLIFYLTFLWENRVTKLLKKFPGPYSYPILGNALALRNQETVVPTILKWREEYGSRFRIIIGTKIKNLVLTAPEDIEKILTSNVIIDKSNAYETLQPWLGMGLLLSSGRKWHHRRKMITPAFHFKILDNFLPIINEHSQVFVDVLKSKCVNGKNNEIGMHSYITRCALDIICETAMGKKLNCQRDLENVYAVATLKESTYLWERWTSPWLQWDVTFALSQLGRDEKNNRKILHDFTDQVIRERKEELQQEEKTSSKPTQSAEDDSVYFSSKKKFAFLDLLIKVQGDEESGLTDQDIREETDTFMFEGHDTTAAGICWAVYLVGLDSEAQAKVHVELDSIFGDDKERPITTADLANMKYLECCIKESLRLYPSVPFFSRLLKQDFQLDNENLVPKGASVLIAPFLIHRNPKIFPNPESFDPSRFFLENASGRHPYAYVPFSAGPRGCIGQRFAYMEEKTVLATLFRNFKVESLDKREDVKPLTELIMRPKNDIRVKLTIR